MPRWKQNVGLLACLALGLLFVGGSWVLSGSTGTGRYPWPPEFLGLAFGIGLLALVAFALASRVSTSERSRLVVGSVLIGLVVLAGALLTILMTLRAEGWWQLSAALPVAVLLLVTFLLSTWCVGYRGMVAGTHDSQGFPLDRPDTDTARHGGDAVRNSVSESSASGNEDDRVPVGARLVWVSVVPLVCAGLLLAGLAVLTDDGDREWAFLPGLMIALSVLLAIFTIGLAGASVDTRRHYRWQVWPGLMVLCVICGVGATVGVAVAGGEHTRPLAVLPVVWLISVFAVMIAARRTRKQAGVTGIEARAENP